MEESNGLGEITLPRSKRQKPPPSWLVPGSDESIPQELVEARARAEDQPMMMTAEAVAPTAAPPKQWLDCSSWLDYRKVAQLGYGGVLRYDCADWNTGPGTSMPDKRISYPELQKILDAGLDFQWNYEDGSDDFNDGYAAWKRRGEHSADYGDRVLHLPHGIGSAASCDMDVGYAMSPTQLESMRGFADGYQLGTPGVYGSSVVINQCHAAGLAKWGWLTVASFYSHGVPTDKAHFDQVGSAFGGAAGVNHVLIAPHYSYRQVTDRVTEDDLSAEAELNIKKILEMVQHERQLVKLPNDTKIWYGDRVTRRWVNDPKELAGLQATLRARGFDGDIYTLSPSQQLDEWGLEYPPPA